MDNKDKELIMIRTWQAFIFVVFSPLLFVLFPLDFSQGLHIWIFGVYIALEAVSLVLFADRSALLDFNYKIFGIDWVNKKLHDEL